MARSLRIQFDGAWYHVMNRGLSHQLIYHTDQARNLFIQLLGDIHRKFAIQTHAYCLMDNHYHLLLHTPMSNLSKAMRYLDGVYTQRVNKSTNRDGPLFRGRYKSILVDENNYLLQLSRYIHLNPVSARIVEKAEDYHWSSYRTYLKVVCNPAWLYCDNILAQFPPDQIKNYSNFILDGVDLEISDLFSKSALPNILGDNTFIENIQRDKIKKIVVHPEIPATRKIKPLPNLESALQAIASAYNISIADVKRRGTRYACNPLRNLLIYFFSTFYSFSHQEIAEAMGGINYSGVSKLKKRMDAELQNNVSYQQELKKLENIISPMSNVKT